MIIVKVFYPISIILIIFLLSYLLYLNTRNYCNCRAFNNTVVVTICRMRKFMIFLTPGCHPIFPLHSESALNHPGPRNNYNNNNPPQKRKEKQRKKKRKKKTSSECVKARTSRLLRERQSRWQCLEASGVFFWLKLQPDSSVSLRLKTKTFGVYCSQLEHISYLLSLVLQARFTFS